MVYTNRQRRDRITGSEQEFGLIVTNGNGGYSHADLYELVSITNPFKGNGSKAHLDVKHMEYATPETRNALDLVLYEKAGELIAEKEIQNQSSYGLRLVKDTGDFSRHSYGAHESYILKRKTSLADVKDAILPFLVTRIVFTGSGFPTDGGYVISQRAGAIEAESCDALHSGQKGIFHTRDEPLADRNRYIRLHGSGDANMSEMSIFLKHATMELILNLFEDGKLERLTMRNYVKTFHEISKDLSLTKRYEVQRKRGHEIIIEGLTAIEIQRVYQRSAEREYKGSDSLTDQILERWRYTLDMLETNPMELADSIDWVIKYALIDSYTRKHEKQMNDASVKMLHVKYHEINKNESLFYNLQHRGNIERLLKDEDITKASYQPPMNTRARIRGRVVSDGCIPHKDVNWDFLTTVWCQPYRRIATCFDCGNRHGCYHSRSRAENIKIDEPYQTYEDLYPEKLAHRLSQNHEGLTPPTKKTLGIY